MSQDFEMESSEVIPETVNINDGGAGIIKGQTVNIKDGGAGIITGRTISVRDGGAAFMVADHIDITEGGAILLVAKEVSGEAQFMIDIRAAIVLGAVAGLIISLLKNLMGNKS